MKTRAYPYDNLRFLLIALVVLGHLLEITAPFPQKEILYRAIYSFHMPAFLFLSGIFARFDRERLLLGLCLPYLLLQPLYILLSRALEDPGAPMQFSRPYWILWYLLALMVYTALIPAYDVPSRRGRLLMVTAAVALALLAGFDPNIGYQWSASRILVFQPWFLLGFYSRREEGLQERWKGLSPVPKALLSALALLCWAGLQLWLFQCRVSSQMLYGAQGYAALNFTWQVRAMSMCCAACALFLLFFAAAEHLCFRIPVLTAIGRNSLPVYLFHGFLIRLLGHSCGPLPPDPLLLLALWAAILLLLGNPLVCRCTELVFRAGWYVRLRAARAPEQSAPVRPPRHP